MNGRTNLLTIRTPEGIEFSMQLAGPTTRFFAWLIDFAIILIAISTINVILYQIALMGRAVSIVIADSLFGLAVVSAFAINIGYGMVLEWFWRGQTVGKYALRLRVIDEQGLRLQFSQIAIRNLLRLVDSLPALYLVGGIACILTKRCQRLGDFAANTVVTYTPRIAEPDFAQILGGKYNSLRDYPHVEARLRQRVSAEEARIALQAVMRRDALEPKARVDLFRELAAHFKKLAPIPEEALVGVADEQFIRNVVDCLFRPQGASAPPELGTGRRSESTA